MPPEYMQYMPNCPGYDPLAHAPQVGYYDEEIIPRNITFNSYSPPNMKTPKMWKSCVGEGKSRICTNQIVPGVPGWQFSFTNESGLCGQIAVAAVLKAMIPGEAIDVNLIIDKWKVLYNIEGGISYTWPSELADFMNKAFGDKVHAWYGADNNDAERSWGGERQVIEELINGWFSQGTYVLAIISIDANRTTSDNPIRDKKHGGHLNYGYVDSINHGETCTYFNAWTLQDDEMKCHRVPHWVVITGVSDQWKNETSDLSPWKWIRIFNPYQGQTEYYWWGDFMSSWDGRMIRIDPADANNTCNLNGGFCNDTIP
jgi:hypothetical protein